ncbi:MAG: CPBP family intramembrane glutamic endopeptidase [Phormidium sp.]
MSLKTKGVLTYLAIAFVPAWLYWTMISIAGFSGTNPAFQAVALPGAFAPALACFIVRKWVTKEGFADAGLSLNFKQNWRYYLFAWLLPLGVTAVIIALATLFNFSQPDFSLQRFFSTLNLPDGIPETPNNIWFIILPTLLIQAIIIATHIVWGEEFGWRSYLQIRLFAERPLMAAISTGLIWGIWHYPLIFLGYEQYKNQLLGLLIFTGFTVLLSIILGWLRLKTGSVWAASLGHGATNAIGGSLTLMLFSGERNWIWVGYNGILAWIPLGIVCVWIIFTGQLHSVKEGSR